jgi:2-polyprenyl-6-methoxyphenol hydroxylase-like FAD-dependent oxidoreductase
MASNGRYKHVHSKNISVAPKVGVFGRFFERMSEADQPLKSVGIVGGGLGGLVLAGLLVKQAPNLRVTVYERDDGPVSREQGYQIGINPDGAKVVNQLGIPELRVLLKQHSYITGFVLCDGNLRRLMGLKNMGGKGRGLGLVHRWKFREALAKAVETQIQWGKRFVEYKELEDKVQVKFEDGDIQETDLLVGCDGARSLVRAQRCPEIKYGPIPDLYMTFGFVRDMDFAKEVPNFQKYMKDSLVRICGRNGQGLLLIQAQDDRFGEKGVTWAMSFRKSPEMKLPDPNDESQVREFLLGPISEGIHPEFKKIVEATKQKIPMNPMNTTSFPDNYKQILGKTTRVTLLGDSAHAMTTQAGIGANTAFMDANDLAKAIGDGTGNWRRRIAKYEQEMMNRGVKNMKTSLSSSQSIHQHGAAARNRDIITWVIGRFMFVVQIMINSWNWISSWFTKEKLD